MISDRLKTQIKALQSISDGVITEVEGMRQTVEVPKSLVLDPKNAMTHNKQNLDAISNSLNQFGFRKNAIAGIKRCRIVQDKLRNWKKGFSDIVMETCCGLHNFRLNFRPWCYETPAD